MSIPTHDLLGRPITELERQVAELHAAVASLYGRSDLPPCIAANAASAMALTWQMMNDLDLDARRPEDLDQKR
jgi:hypothetical protein